MPTQIPAKFDAIIASAEYIWFTTVNDEGMPQPTPVWFIREGDAFVIYTTPDSKKVDNMRAHPEAALGVATEGAGSYFVLHGEAIADHTIPPANRNAAYMAKYTDGIAGIGMTPDSFAQRFSLPIRVTASHVRGEVE